MKKILLLTSIIFNLLIINSCNSKEETAPNNVVPIPESPVVETKQADPQQNWKESFLSDKTIETGKDIEPIKQIIDKAVENNTLDELQTFLETESKKEKVPPQILFGLSLVYGRKGLVKEEYKAIEKLEEQVKQRPGIVFNLSLVYGRKETLKSQIDKAEAKAVALLQGLISVISNPPGADVFINGKRKGTTPFTTVGLKEGSYAVELRLKDYTDLSKTISVKAGKTTEVAEELVLIPGSLTINSEPVGSTVLLDGEEVGVTPLNLEDIIPGIHEAILKKNDYENRTVSIKVKPGKTETIDTRLVALKGTLKLDNLTFGAKVYINGIKQTINYNRIENIDPGNNQLLISKEGYLDKKENFFIPANQVINIDCELSYAIPYAFIKVDGKETDWNLIEPVIIDNTGDTKGPAGTDLHKIFIATDGTYLYTKINLADGSPSKRPLFYAIGIETPDKSFSRLLFTQYDRTWATGVDKWTNKSSGHHEQVGKGTIKTKNGIIEARYKLKDIGISLDQQLLINAWDDPSGKSYDNTTQEALVWTNHSEYFVAQGTIRGKKISERTLSPLVQHNQGSDKVTKIILFNSDKEDIGIQFQIDKIDTGNHRLSEKEFKSILFSSIIEEAEGYNGNLISGELNILENSRLWLSGSFNFKSNIGDNLSGFFSVIK